MQGDKPPNSKKIPASGLARMAKIGGLASRIAGNMLTGSIKQLSKGNRPNVKDLLLTPGNMLKVAEQLAQMRGAAMKIGQLISMDAGEVLPAELSEILARLRSDAIAMPEKDLDALLRKQWGHDWRQQFIQFDLRPIAAASIGQVHKAISKDLRRLAIKIQYPGIKQSIDSDVDNVAVLIKLSGLLPRQINLQALLSEAKKQLHDEANYTLEAQRIEQYHHLIDDDEDFTMPSVYPPLCSNNVLAMTYMEGEPIESLVGAPQSKRNAVVSSLFNLFFRELFDARLMQTDPNFANFLYDHHSEKIVLLDFGATREIDSRVASGYRILMRAGAMRDEEGLRQAAEDIGLISSALDSQVQHSVTDLCMQACEPLSLPGTYDFAHSDLASRLHQQGLALGLEKTYGHTPPVDCLFLHRKLGGLFLLALRLKAEVDFHELFSPYESPS